MTDDVRNVHEALSAIVEHWQPHRLTSVNDYDVKVVKLQGGFVWHTHPETDELFMVVSGRLTIQLRDRDVILNPNDIFVVPRGVEHCPKATAEVEAILFERWRRPDCSIAGTQLTGANSVVARPRHARRVRRPFCSSGSAITAEALGNAGGQPISAPSSCSINRAITRRAAR